MTDKELTLTDLDDVILYDGTAINWAHAHPSFRMAVPVKQAKRLVRNSAGCMVFVPSLGGAVAVQKGAMLERLEYNSQVQTLAGEDCDVACTFNGTDLVIYGMVSEADNLDMEVSEDGSDDSDGFEG